MQDHRRRCRIAQVGHVAGFVFGAASQKIEPDSFSRPRCSDDAPGFAKHITAAKSAITFFSPAGAAFSASRISWAPGPSPALSCATRCAKRVTAWLSIALCEPVARAAQLAIGETTLSAKAATPPPVAAPTPAPAAVDRNRHLAICRPTAPNPDIPPISAPPTMPCPTLPASDVGTAMAAVLFAACAAALRPAAVVAMGTASVPAFNAAIFAAVLVAAASVTPAGRTPPARSPKPVAIGDITDAPLHKHPPPHAPCRARHGKHR